jgi:hypothetical protein
MQHAEASPTPDTTLVSDAEYRLVCNAPRHIPALKRHLEAREGQPVAWLVENKLPTMLVAARYFTQDADEAKAAQINGRTVTPLYSQAAPQGWQQGADKEPLCYLLISPGNMASVAFTQDEVDAKIGGNSGWRVEELYRKHQEGKSEPSYEPGTLLRYCVHPGEFSHFIYPADARCPYLHQEGQK